MEKREMSVGRLCRRNCPFVSINKALASLSDALGTNDKSSQVREGEHSHVSKIVGLKQG